MLLLLFKNKITSASIFVQKTDYNTKINDIEKKITDHNHERYITTAEFNKLTSEHFAARLKQANLADKSDIANFVNKTDFDNKLSGFNRKINSNKTKHVLVDNELKNYQKKFNYYQQKIITFL